VKYLSVFQCSGTTLDYGIPVDTEQKRNLTEETWVMIIKFMVDMAARLVGGMKFIPIFSISPKVAPCSIPHSLDISFQCDVKHSPLYADDCKRLDSTIFQFIQEMIGRWDFKRRDTGGLWAPGFSFLGV